MQCRYRRTNTGFYHNQCIITLIDYYFSRDVINKVLCTNIENYQHIIEQVERDGTRVEILFRFDRVVPSFVGNRDKLRYSVARQCFLGGINEYEQSFESFLEPSVESSVGAPLIPSLLVCRHQISSHLP